MKLLISALTALAVCGYASAAPAPVTGTFTTSVSPHTSVPTEDVIFANTPGASPSAISPSWRSDTNRNLFTGQSFILTQGSFDLSAITLQYRNFGVGIEGHDFKLNVYQLDAANGDFADATHLLSATGNLPDVMTTPAGNAGMLTFTLGENDRITLASNVYYLVTFGFGSPTGSDANASVLRLQTIGSGVTNAGGGYRYDSSNGGASFPAGNLQAANGLEIYLQGTPAIPESSSYALGCGIALLLFVGLKRVSRRK